MRSERRQSGSQHRPPGKVMLGSAGRLRAHLVNRLRGKAQGFFLVSIVHGADPLDRPKPLAQCLLKDLGLGSPGASRPNAYVTH